MIGIIRSTCAREAISGTTPLQRACSSSWLATTLERIRLSGEIIAAAVSSQVVSMARSGMDQVYLSSFPVPTDLGWSWRIMINSHTTCQYQHDFDLMR